MLKKIFIGLALVCAVVTSAQSRNEIYTVRINDLVYNVPDSKTTAGEVIGTVLETLAGSATNSVHPELAPEVTSAVKTALNDVRRLAPVTGDAAFEFTGEITTISTTTSSRTETRTDSKKKTYTVVVNDYSAKLGVSLTLTDLATGQQWTNSFSTNGLDFYSFSGEKEALDMALSQLRNDVRKYYNNMFPLEANIVERGKEKKDKMKEVYIDLGEANGVQKGMHFSVYILGQVAGKETRKKIGRLKIEEVMGDDISLCKVDKGSKEIKTAIDGGETLLVISQD